MHCDGLKLAVSKLVELFTGEIYDILAVSLNLDIGPQLHQTLIGKGGGNVRKIMDATETRFDTGTSMFCVCAVIIGVYNRKLNPSAWEYQSAVLGYNYHTARQSGALLLYDILVITQ